MCRRVGRSQGSLDPLFDAAGDLVAVGDAHRARHLEVHIDPEEPAGVAVAEAQTLPMPDALKVPLESDTQPAP